MRKGDIVELRSPAQILATLDDAGCLDGLPFMPEMLGYFGRAYRVEARVERACDTITQSGVRRIPDTVLLDDLRCDGAGHSGCQAQCRLYWKEAWLQPSSADRSSAPPDRDTALDDLERLALANARVAGPTDGVPTFRSQATEMLRASEPVDWWSMRSFVNELTGGNVGPWHFLRGMLRVFVDEVGRRLRIASDLPFRTTHRHAATNGTTAPRGLRPGDLVQVRPADEIARTLDERGKNRGLWFDREMVPFSGKTTHVKTKVERFIDERTGRLVELGSDCYILEGFVCSGDRSYGRAFCPRAIYPWWREAWLKDLGDAGARPADSDTAAGAGSDNGSHLRA